FCSSRSSNSFLCSLQIARALGPPPKRQEERKRGLTICVKADVIFRGEPLTNPLDAGSPRVDEVFKNHLRWAVIELVYKEHVRQTSATSDAPSPLWESNDILDSPAREAGASVKPGASAPGSRPQMSKLAEESVGKS